MFLSSIVIALVLVGGTTTPKVTEQITNRMAMKEAVLRAVPPRSTIAHAEQFMVQEGFQCLRATDASFVEQARVYQHIDYVYCNRTNSAGFPVTQRWQIALVYEKDYVTDVLVSTGLIGP